MNLPIRKVAVAIGVLFLALFLNLNLVQVVQGDSLRDHPGNRRVLLNEYASPRGQIVVQGQAVAESTPTNDGQKYLRSYPGGALYAPLTGYFSFIYGRSGVEESADSILSGDDPRLFTTRLSDLITGRNPKGGTVELTINRDAQQAAYNAMKDAAGNLRRGAVVAIDPSTGAILAAVSTPSFDPNILSSHQASAQQRGWRCYQNPTDYVTSVVQSTIAGASPALGGAEVARLDAAIPRWAAQEMAWRAQNTYDADTAGSAWVTQPDANWSDSYVQQIGPPLPCGAYTETGAHQGGAAVPAVPDDPTAFFRAYPSDPGPMLNRAFDQVYPPGSVFKIIDAAAALALGDTPGTRIPAANGYWPFDPTKTTACPKNDPSSSCVQNFEGETCDNGVDATLAFALAKSCNTAFAALVVEKIGGDRLARQAQAFGLAAPYGETVPDLCHPPALLVPLPVCTSTLGSNQDLTDPGALSHTAFGQQDVRFTPLQAAMLSAAVANNGTLMKPYLIAKELGPNLSTISQASPTEIGQAVDPALVPALQSMMEGVVAPPPATGGAAAITDIPGVVVGGKTGTADTGLYSNGPSNDWFSGFALKNGQPRIAVAVIIEPTNGA
ncbi:MAG: hypothetical protein EPN43_03475, partial [Jatrophihabitans sp.]